MPQIQERLKTDYNSAQGRDDFSSMPFNKKLKWIKRFYDKGSLISLQINNWSEERKAGNKLTNILKTIK